jgi:hypothetical protein
MKSGIKPEIVLKSLSIQTAAQTQQSFESEEYLHSQYADTRMQPEELVEIREGLLALYTEVNNLDYTTREVIKRKLGMDKYDIQSNDEISQALTIQPNRVRRIFAKGIAELKKTGLNTFFQDYLPREFGEPLSLVPESAAERTITALVELDSPRVTGFGGD